MLFGDEVPFKTVVYRRFTQLIGGRSTIDDDVSEGRPCTLVVAKNIDAVMILADWL